MIEVKQAAKIAAEYKHPPTSHLLPSSLFRLLTTVLLPIFLLLLTAFTPPPQTGPIQGRAKTQARPVLSGPVLTDSTEHFVIHYTLEGVDAVSLADEDENDRPDFVEAVAEALEFSWQQQVEYMGWRAPLPDQGEGGDTRLDVYLEDQADESGQSELFGYMDSYGGYVGDYPETTTLEDGAAYGYLSLDNDYSPDQFGEEFTPLDSMRGTAAHELNHALQAAYDDGEPYEWLYEASAVWMENEVYPEIDGAQTYLVDYLDAPDLCPLSVGRDDQDVRWYGDWILLRYLAEHYGGPETIRQLWEHAATLEGLAALEATLAEQETNVAELLVNFSVANLTKSDCPNNTPYCYAHGSSYLRPYVETSLGLKRGEIKTFIAKDGVQQFGADYLRLRSEGPFQLHFRGSVAGEWQLRLVGLSGDQAEVMPVEMSRPTPIDPSPFEKLYLVIVNTAPVEIEADCGYHNYTLALTAGTETARPAPPVPPDPGPYVPPGYDLDEAAEPAPLLEGGQPITDAEAPFPPLYPGYLPPDYVLTQMVSYTMADLGESAPDYAPGGEPILAIEYNGTAEGSFLSITQSQTPYPNLSDWVASQGYLESDIRLVNNQPVHLVDYSSAKTGPFSVATLVYHDLFIVIDGTLDAIEIQQVAAGFLANNP